MKGRKSGIEYQVNAIGLAREVLEKAEFMIEGTPYPDPFWLSARNKALSIIKRAREIIDTEANRRYLQRLYYEAKKLHDRVF